MEEFERIRELFRPIQPTVAENDRSVSYREVSPTGQLSFFVSCFWQLRSARPLPEPYTYRVVSDGCIDLFFDLVRPADCDIMGFCRRYTQFAIGTRFNYVGIRFLPSAFPLLFGIDARRLSDRSQPLREILPDLADWISKTMGPEVCFEQLIPPCCDKLNRTLADRDIAPDHRFFAALTSLLRSGGNLNVETQLNTGLSPRQMRRYCQYFLGTSPKVFATVVRFQNVLSLAGPKAERSAVNVYQEAGFYDQAHFIRTFRRFYGVTPGVALG